MNAWEMFEAAVTGPEELYSARLQAAISYLDQGQLGSPGERAELKAAALSLLAGRGLATLADAERAVTLSASFGHRGWPNYYLAQAAIRTGRFSLALAQLQEIPQDFFEARQLDWRTVHTWELEAIAQLALGHDLVGQGLVNRIVRSLASRGDDDDLASPIDLVTYLVNQIREDPTIHRHLLEIVCSSIDVTAWFDETIVKQIQDALVEET